MSSIWVTLFYSLLKGWYHRHFWCSNFSSSYPFPFACSVPAIFLIFSYQTLTFGIIYNLLISPGCAFTLFRLPLLFCDLYCQIRYRFILIGIFCFMYTRQVTRATHVRNRVCPRVELILKIIIILQIIFLGFIKSLLLSAFPIRGRHSGFSFSSFSYQL